MGCLLDIGRWLCCNPGIVRPSLPPLPGVTVMSRLSRRKLLQTAAAASAAFPLFTIAGTKASGKVIGANDTVRIGVAGIGGRGGSHMSEWTSQEKVQITYLIDPDTQKSGRGAQTVEGRQKTKPKTVQDIR